MAKNQTRLRGPTRPLSTRLEDGKNRVALLENMTFQADLQREAAILKRKIFKPDFKPGPKKD